MARSKTILQYINSDIWSIDIFNGFRLSFMERNHFGFEEILRKTSFQERCKNLDEFICHIFTIGIRMVTYRIAAWVPHVSSKPDRLIRLKSYFWFFNTIFENICVKFLFCLLFILFETILQHFEEKLWNVLVKFAPFMDSIFFYLRFFNLFVNHRGWLLTSFLRRENIEYLFKWVSKAFKRQVWIIGSGLNSDFSLITRKINYLYLVIISISLSILSGHSIPHSKWIGQWSE